LVSWPGVKNELASLTLAGGFLEGEGERYENLTAVDFFKAPRR
jgi:hypothetical protein